MHAGNGILHTTIPSANNAVRQILHHIDRCRLNLTAFNLPPSPPRRNVFSDPVHMLRCLSHQYRPVDAGPHKLKPSDVVSALHANTSRFGNAASQMRVRDLCLAAAIILGATTSLASPEASAVQGTPRSLLILDQSTSFRLWPSAIIAGMRSELAGNLESPTAIYVEHLDLHQFRGAEYQDSLEQYFSEKYRDRS